MTDVAIQLFGTSNQALNHPLIERHVRGGIEHAGSRTARLICDDSLSNRLLYGYGATRTGHILTKDEIRKLRASPYLTP